MTTVELGRIHLFKTDGTRRNKKGMIVRHSEMVHDAHRVALGTEGGGYRDNIKTFRAQRRGPEQRVKRLENVHDGRERGRKIVGQGRVPIAMDDKVVNGRLVRVLVELHRERLDPKIVEVVVAYESVHLFFLGRRELGDQAFKKTGPFVVCRKTKRSNDRRKKRRRRRQRRGWWWCIHLLFNLFFPILLSWLWRVEKIKKFLVKGKNGSNKYGGGNRSTISRLGHCPGKEALGTRGVEGAVPEPMDRLGDLISYKGQDTLCKKVFTPQSQFSSRTNLGMGHVCRLGFFIQNNAHVFYCLDAGRQPLPMGLSVVVPKSRNDPGNPPRTFLAILVK